jgi:hypothetical protein
MGGLFILGMLGLWAWFALWLSGVIAKFVFAKRLSTASENAGGLSLPLTAMRVAVRFILALLLITLPFIDQLIAYPKWQQLCKTTGDFEWGPGMDEKTAFGREVLVVNERVTSQTIFPNIKIDFSGWYVYDAKTQELIFKKPHYSYSAEAFLYIPSDSGNRNAIFLPECNDYTFFRKDDDIFEKLNLTQVEHKGVLK